MENNGGLLKTDEFSGCEICGTDGEPVSVGDLMTAQTQHVRVRALKMENARRRAWEIVRAAGSFVGWGGFIGACMVSATCVLATFAMGGSEGCAAAAILLGVLSFAPILVRLVGRDGGEFYLTTECERFLAESSERRAENRRAIAERERVANSWELVSEHMRGDARQVMGLVRAFEDSVTLYNAVYRIRDSTDGDEAERELRVLRERLEEQRRRIADSIGSLKKASAAHRSRSKRELLASSVDTLCAESEAYRESVTGCLPDGSESEATPEADFDKRLLASSAGREGE